MTNEYRTVANILENWNDDLETTGVNAIKNALMDARVDSFEEFVRIGRDRAFSAAMSTKEFAQDIFIEPLLKVFEDYLTYQVSLLDFNELTGDFRAVYVFVFPQRVGGDISDYFDAVEFVRTNFKMDSTPEEASAYWEFIYKAGRVDMAGFEGIGMPGHLVEPAQAYEWTIQQRLSYFQGLAPFWEIIDKGTMFPAYGRGGYPYPDYGPTNFVHTIEKLCQEEFDYYYSTALRSYTQKLKEAQYGGDTVFEAANEAIETGADVPYRRSPVIELLRKGIERFTSFFKIRGS